MHAKGGGRHICMLKEGAHRHAKEGGAERRHTRGGARRHA